MSDPFVVNVDTTSPNAPQVWLDPDSDTGIKGDGITNDNLPTIDGKTEPGAEVSITFPTGETITVVADDNGDWKATPTQPLPEGDNKITVIASDDAGNTSDPTVISVGIDTTPPDSSKLSISGVMDNEGPVTGNIVNGGITDDARPVISGTGTAGDTITVYSKDFTGNHPVGTTIVKADGTWSLQPDFKLVSGLNDLTAVESDPAGNATDPSAKYSFTLDTGKPQAPAIESVFDDVGPYTGFL
ncbi:Ig-like domain-containing protein, partial [Pseudomonas nitroreducens]